ncbi:MAG: DciA family protein [Thiohalospira sp.]
MRRPKPLDDLLSDAGVAERARRLARADEVLRASLPTVAAPHVRLANLRGGCAILHADSAAWAERLRYLRATILEALGEGVADLKIRVVTPEAEPPLRSTPRKPPPEVAGRTLEQLADHCEPRLASALRRLARHARTE